MNSLYYSLSANFDRIMDDVIKEVRQAAGTDSNAENRQKQLCAFHASSVREITEQVNLKGLKEDDIVQVVNTEDGFFLLYWR